MASCNLRVSTAILALLPFTAACSDSSVSSRLPEDTTAVVVEPRTVAISAQPNVFSEGSTPLSAELRDASGRVLLDERPAWATDDSAVAIVNSEGLVAGRRAGATTIWATSQRGSAAAYVTVDPASDDDVRVIAHRGFRLWFPENTLVAITGAFDKGADAVEIDIRLSKDRVPVVMHDATVDRTTNGTGAVRDLTAAQLTALNACAKAGAKWPACPLPTLEQALAAAHGRGGMLLHLYGDYTAEDLRRMLAMVRAAGLDHRVVFICFDYPVLSAIRQLDPVVPLGYLMTSLPASLTPVQALGRAAVVPGLSAVFASPTRASQMLLDARRSGIDAATWIITTPADAKAALRLGFRRLISDIPLEREDLEP